METTFDCAIKGKAVNADDCATISLQASADDFHKCLKCTRGQAVAKTANWKTDAAIAQSTAQASASTGGLKCGAANSAKPIMLTLRNVGAKAGTEKRFQVFRMAPTSDASEISRI